MSTNRKEIRKAILAQSKPFYTQDLICRLQKEGITDKRMILDELDELFYEGLVKFDKVPTDSKEETQYAFFIE